MLEAKKAAFSFDSFKVPKFSYNEGNHFGSELTLGFLPSGKYNPKDGKFDLTLEFITHVSSQENTPIFELTAVATFIFDAPIPLSDIPEFFYKNSIAIMFPYVRAFVSTLTLQANTKLLRLGVMNLSDLDKPLKERTVEI